MNGDWVVWFSFGACAVHKYGTGFCTDKLSNKLTKSIILARQSPTKIIKQINLNITKQIKLLTHICLPAENVDGLKLSLNEEPAFTDYVKGVFACKHDDSANGNGNGEDEEPSDRLKRLKIIGIYFPF